MLSSKEPKVGLMHLTWSCMRICQSAYNSDADVDPAILRRLAEKLQLTSLDDLKQESFSLYEMVAASDGDPGEGIEKVSMLLKKIKDFVQTENPDMARPANSCLPSSGAVRVPTDGNAKSPAIPDDFRCPISLELMKDPVFVSTGQTYERSCIKKWLDDGHGTCPKSQQSLTSTALTPNYVMRSLIAQWSEANGIDPPKHPINSNPNDPTSVCSCPELAKVEDLICKRSSSSIDDLCSAAGELFRFLCAKMSSCRNDFAFQDFVLFAMPNDSVLL